MRRRAFSGPGGAALQAATVGPLLVVIGLGVAELAALARDNVALTSLAREGGRTATTTQADPGAAAGADWSTDLSRCAERSASSLGVYLKADHRFPTHAVTGSTAISHHAVFPIEPSHRCPDRG